MAGVEEKTDKMDVEEDRDKTPTDSPNSETPEDVPAAKMDTETVLPEQVAEQKKTEGNELYKKKDYTGALKLYSEAIDLCPSCSAYYGNRAATYMMLSQYDKALEDARRSTQIDPTFVKGYQREAKCQLALGEVATAILLYDKVLELEPGNSVAKTENQQARAVQQYVLKAQTCYNKADYRTVIFCMDKSIELSPECLKFRILKAESLALLKRYEEAQNIASDVLRQDGLSADAIYVRGLCLYYQDSIEKAFQHFQQVLRLAPDHAKARDVYRRAKQLMTKKEEGNAAFKAGNSQQAYDLYTEALQIDPNNVFTNSKLYFNRATVCNKMNKKENAVEDCTKAIALDEKYMKAFLRRAKCYMELEQYEEAVRDYEKVCKMDKSRENRQLLQEAKLELKKSKRKDYYKVLGIGKDANEDAVKKAYRKHALLHHPDRHADATEEVKKAEEKKFKEIGEAYSVLSDAKKKARYDSGQDLEENEGMGGFSDPNVIFQTFFGGGGSHFGGFSQQGFPGGFTFQFG